MSEAEQFPDRLPVMRIGVWAANHYFARLGRLEPWARNLDADAPGLRFTFDDGTVAYGGFVVDPEIGTVAFHAGPSPILEENPIVSDGVWRVWDR